MAHQSLAAAAMTVAAEFDPHKVPIKDAATILIFDDRPDLHVLMMRRKNRSDFVGGMMVFPGGGLDEADRDVAIFSRISGEVAEDQRSYLVASIRETFEECGVLLSSTPPPSDALALREAVQREDVTLAELLDRFDLTIDAHDIHPVARWITPPGPSRRYDTMFFACAMPPAQEATSDDDEAEHLEWVRPAEGMARWAAGDYVMLPPTTAMLKLLMQYPATEAVLDALRRADDDMAAVLVVGHERGQYRVILPGEDDYEEHLHGDRRPESGWMRRLP